MTEKGPEYGGVNSFDTHHPPERNLLDDCVHCGFCLPTCPTYQVGGEEMDSPRGRILLMDLAEHGEVPLEGPFQQHIDSCLGCLACVTSCPSGVQYDRLIDAVRPQIERNTRRSWSDRLFRELIFQVFPHPGRLRAAAVPAWLYQRLGIRWLVGAVGLRRLLPARLRALEALVPPVRVSALLRRTPSKVTSKTPPRLRVAMLAGCVQRVFFDDVNRATMRVLAAEGCEVLIPNDQGCCGALSMHSGRESEAVRLARRTVDVFDQYEVDAVVVNVAGCGSVLKEYAELLRDDAAYAQRAAALAAKVRDIHEILDDLAPVAPRHPIPARLAYHDACHLSHGQKVRDQPRQVLRTVPELEVVDIADPDICCGSAGVYNMLQPDMAEELGQRKVANVLAAEPDAVATGNPGCLLQINRHLKEEIPLLHPVQVLDASIRGMNPFQ